MKYNPLIFICILSCVFFQVAPMIVVLVSPLIQESIPFTENPYFYSGLLVLAIALILIGYYFTKHKTVIGLDIYDQFNKYQPHFWKIGESIAYFLFIPALISALFVYIRLMQQGYGDVEPTTLIDNLILYSHLMGISFLFAGYNNSISHKKLFIPFALIIFPRFLISTAGPRVFVFQALLPVFFFIFPILKDYIRKYFVFVLLFAFILFILPYLIGNRVGGELDAVSIYIVGSPITYLIHSPLKVFYNMHLVFAGLLYSWFGWDMFGYKQMFDLGSYKVRFDWIFTRLTIGPEGEHHLGTGGNPVFEAYSEGIIGYIILFIIVGVVCSYFDFRKKSMFNRFVFPHIIAKVGFLWRGTFVELFDRALTYFIIYFIIYYGCVYWENKKELG